MSDNSEDMAVNALSVARTEVAPELDLEIIRQVYAIERSHQFDEAREVTLKSLQKLVEDLVAAGVPK
ncbi:MAG: hypothetical protein NVSMB28_00270 [Collimonas sp.]